MRIANAKNIQLLTHIKICAVSNIF